MNSIKASTKNLIPIALDAMGGDFAPSQVVAGAVAAVRTEGIPIILVGDKSMIETELKAHSVDNLPITIVPSDGVVEEGEQPTKAFRTKPKASIFTAVGLVHRGKAGAVVSMGSSGATIAAATLLFGTFEGIERATLGGPIIGLSPKTVVIDVGTNVDCRPHQLADFAALGTAMCRIIQGVKDPRVAILSVGAEAGKGNRLVKETTDLLEASNLTFIGNVEASDLPFDRAEVVICDGFVGNVVMKLTEGLGDALSIHARGLEQKGSDDIADFIYEMTNQVEVFGGGPILGVNGVAIVGHGRAKAVAVQRAVQTAHMCVATGFVQATLEELTRLRDTVRA